MDSHEVIRFWFEEIPSSAHFKKDKKFDQKVWDRFNGVHRAATAGELFSWRRDPSGRLAEILVLDQFSRNMFRDKPEAFASDSLALILAQEAVACGAPGELESDQRAFFYMPYMHSESRVIHEEAVKLFSEDGLEGTLKYEIQHKAIIDRFGRFPHRNKILGRPSSPEELSFLKEKGSSF